MRRPTTPILALAVIAAAATLVPQHAHAQATKPVLTLEQVKRVVAAAEAEAARNDWNVVIAVVDDGGNLMYLQRNERVQLASLEIAQKKARSAAYYRRATKGFSDALAEGRTAVLTLPDAMPLEGGVPLLIGEVVVGAIGVSGVTAQQDGQIAAAGAAVLPN